MTMLATLALLSFFASADPNVAIGQARQLMNQKQYEPAARVLQEAIPDAANLADPQRSQALSALHFFSAMAYSAMENELRSREELEVFFHLTPQIKSIDPKKFDARFVRAFSEVYNALHNEGSGTFESVYPGFALFHEREPKIQKIEEWGESPDLVLLGTSEDKHAWGALTNQESRKAFVETFWSRHDKDGFRKEFLRRVAFADETFTGSRQRGSLTDRGHVFVLIGPPQVIRQKPLTARESTTRIGGPVGTHDVAGGTRPDQDSLRWGAVRANMANDKNMSQIEPTPVAKGGVERWIYNRDQFPQGIPDAEAVFKFITQEGYGDHVLQREFMVNKVLADAATMH
jgi:GWxTD domain-containing protein